MAGAIPIQNIYYLLCYAWDQLAEADEIDVASDECHSLDELFARVLSNGTQQLIKRGLDRDYRLHREETASLKGRFDLSASMAKQTWRQGRMVCEFDELSHDILHNRILKTTISLLAANPHLRTQSLALIHHQEKLLGQIPPIRITSRLFRNVRLHRNNRQYRFLMNVCELIHDSLLPTEEKGDSRFRDFIREKKTMASLFEKFIRNFYAQHSSFAVSAPHLHWCTEGTPESLALVPRMETDVVLYSSEQQIVLDCKFYKDAFKAKGEARARFNSNHLYQITAYLRNARREKEWPKVEGILLYPAVGHDFYHDLQLDGSRLQIASINLDQDWQNIHRRLLSLLAPSD